MDERLILLRGGAHGERETLAGCYRACFGLAEAHAVQSIAFPAISTGRYRFPLDEAVAISRSAMATALARNPALAEVRVVCFEQPVYQAYAQGRAHLCVPSGTAAPASSVETARSRLIGIAGSFALPDMPRLHPGVQKRKAQSAERKTAGQSHLLGRRFALKPFGTYAVRV